MKYQAVKTDDPPVHVVPRMGTITPDEPKVWRVKDSELDEIHSWLIERLLPRFPRLNPDGVWVMMRAAIIDRHIVFARTKDVVGMFDISPGNVLENMPIITERFVRQRGRHVHTKDNEQGILLYRYVRDFGKSIRAREFHWGAETDQPREIIGSALQDVRLGSESQKTGTFRVMYIYD